VRPTSESVKKRVHKRNVRRGEDLFVVGRREKRGREKLCDEFAIDLTFHPAKFTSFAWQQASGFSGDRANQQPPFPSLPSPHPAKPSPPSSELRVIHFCTFSLHPTMAARRAFTALPARAFRSITHQCRYNSSSTSAMAYKAIHRRIAPLPTADTRT